MTRPHYLALAFVLALLLAACGSGTDNDSDAPKAAEPVALVWLGRAEAGAISQQVTLFGTADPGATGKQALAAATDAVVVRIVAPVGSHVGRGDVIVQLAPAPAAKLDLAKAATDARTADAALARAIRLRADGLMSDAEVETARAAAASANATRASLAGRAAMLTVRALAPGYVESIAVSPGELVTAGAAIGVIGRGGDVRARFGIEPALARDLHPGTTMRITASGGAPITAPIDTVNPTVDPATRLASVFARLPAAAGIAPGETLQATLDLGGARQGLTVPYAALLDDGGQPFVFVVKGNSAHRRDVAIGPASGDRIAITTGLSAGDLVVTQGGTALEDGMKVRTR